MLQQTAERTRASRARVRDFIQLCRPTQWIKNVVVFAGPAAGMRLMEPQILFHSVVAFIAFCLASSSVYAINDAVDAEADAKHPTKRLRPVARGAIRSTTAMVFAGILIIAAVVVSAVLLDRMVPAVLVMYFVMVLAYSFSLKHKILLDVIVIAMGFVLRAWAGAAAAGVEVSDWLVACMFTLCLFLGFGKRRCELVMLNSAEEASKHRRTLVRYTPDLLNHLITVSAGIAIITFLLYSLDTSRETPFDKHLMFYTLPIVVYGVFRYAMITELGHYSGPTEIILKDRGLRASILAWGALALGIVYWTTWMKWIPFTE